MKLKYFLPLFAPFLFVDISPALSTPAEILVQYRTREQGDACQASKEAVVTVYAGREIGSGSIVSPDGLVITNFHVVNEVVRGRGRAGLSVRTADGDRYPGQVIATDRQYDLALIQLGAREQFPYVPLASSGVQSGQSVCAIGSPFGRPGVLTRGTVSRVRQNGDLQSNVVLNPGNSGGPLLNSRGEMIGVNKAILQSPSGRNTGISFATSAEATRNFIARNRPNSLPDTIARVPAPRPNPSMRTIEPPPTIARQPLPSNSPLPESLRRQPELDFPDQYPQPLAQSPQPDVNPDLQIAPPTANGHIVTTITDGTNLTAPVPAQVAPESSVNPDFSPREPRDDVYISPQPGAPQLDRQPEANTPFTPPPSIAEVEPQEPLLDVPQPPTVNPRSPGMGKRLGAVVDIRNLVVRQVQSGSPAALGGLRAGDRLLTVNGRQLSDFDALMAFLQRQPGSATFTVNRNRQVATIRVNF